MQYDNRNTGALFLQDKQGNERRPDFTGKVNVDGTEYELAAWKKSSREGKEYLSLSVKPMRTRDDRKPEARAADPVRYSDTGGTPGADDFDDSIPF